MTGWAASMAEWPGRASAGWSDGATESVAGPAEAVFPWASVTKVVTAVAVWVAWEEGTVRLDDPVGPPGATLAHLLSHTSGLDFDSDAVLTGPGRRRIYSNRGFELAAAHVGTRSGMEFGEYARLAVLEPLGMGASRMAGSPAAGAEGPVTDLLRLGRELLHPTLVSPATLGAATSVAFPGLSGVLPGFGRQDPNDWGLGVEIRGRKRPHWTGELNSERTFGHFGHAGSLIWVDPDAGLCLASAGERAFGPWAAAAWPVLSDAVLSGRA